MPLTPQALTTLARLKEYLGITGTTDDGVLISFINRATDFLEQRTNRRFVKTTYTNELHNGREGKDKVFLFNFPIISVASFQFRTGTLASPVFNDFNVNDFIVFKNAGFIQVLAFRIIGVSPSIAAGSTIKGVQNLRVTYDAGFLIDFDNVDNPALHTLPLDIEDFVIRMAARRFNLRRADGVVSEAVEGSSITWASPTLEQLSADDKAVIKKYEKKIVTNEI